jgi:hypothetical protein
MGNDIRHVQRTAKKIRSQFAPKIGHGSQERVQKVIQPAAELRLSGGAEGI